MSSRTDGCVLEAGGRTSDNLGVGFQNSRLLGAVPYSTMNRSGNLSLFFYTRKSHAASYAVYIHPRRLVLPTPACFYLGWMLEVAIHPRLKPQEIQTNARRSHARAADFDQTRVSARGAGVCKNRSLLQCSTDKSPPRNHNNKSYFSVGVSCMGLFFPHKVETCFKLQRCRA